MILQSWHEIKVGNYDMCSQKKSNGEHFQTCGSSLEGECFTHAEVIL